MIPVTLNWTRTGADVDGDPLRLKTSHGDIPAVVTKSRTTGLWSVVVHWRGERDVATEEEAVAKAEAAIQSIVKRRLSEARETLALFDPPTPVAWVRADNRAIIWWGADYPAHWEPGEGYAIYTDPPQPPAPAKEVIEAAGRVGVFLDYATQFSGGVSLGAATLPEQNLRYSDVRVLVDAADRAP